MFLFGKHNDLFGSWFGWFLKCSYFWLKWFWYGKCFRKILCFRLQTFSACIGLWTVESLLHISQPFYHTRAGAKYLEMLLTTWQRDLQGSKYSIQPANNVSCNPRVKPDSRSSKGNRTNLVVTSKAGIFPGSFYNRFSILCWLLHDKQTWSAADWKPHFQ